MGRAQDVNGENAAWAAAKIYYCLGALDLLMREGVDVRGVNKKGETILVAMMRVHAAQAGKMNYMNDRVWTAAEFATYEARERRTVEILLDAHVDFNGKEGETTPLMAAAQGGHGGDSRVAGAWRGYVVQGRGGKHGAGPGEDVSSGTGARF